MILRRALRPESQCILDSPSVRSLANSLLIADFLDQLPHAWRLCWRFTSPPEDLHSSHTSGERVRGPVHAPLWRPAETAWARIVRVAHLMRHGQRHYVRQQAGGLCIRRGAAGRGGDCRTNASPVISACLHALSPIPETLFDPVPTIPFGLQPLFGERPPPTVVPAAASGKAGTRLDAYPFSAATVQNTAVPSVPPFLLGLAVLHLQIYP